MAPTFHRIAPHLPVVWTGPSAIQVGIRPPLASVTDIPDDATPVIHALIDGISDGGLEMLTAEYRLSPSWVEALLQSLAPALSATKPLPPPVTWQLWSSSPGGAAIARLVSSLGIPLTVTSDPLTDELTPAPTIILADYLLHPHWVTQLTRGGAPHLPVVFSDQEVSVGPVITPGITPCLICLESWRQEQTPSWLEIDSQLWGKQSPLHTPTIHGTAATLVLGFLTGTLGWDKTHIPREAIFRPANTATTWREVSLHPSCACRGVNPAED